MIWAAWEDLHLTLEADPWVDLWVDLQVAWVAHRVWALWTWGHPHPRLEDHVWFRRRDKEVVSGFPRVDLLRKVEAVSLLNLRKVVDSLQCLHKEEEVVFPHSLRKVEEVINGRVEEVINGRVINGECSDEFLPCTWIAVCSDYAVRIVNQI